MLLKNKLKALLNTVESLMNEKKFDDALSFYRRINSVYKNLKNEDQDEFYDIVDSYNYDITVYFKIKEAMLLFQDQKDIHLVREKLDRIEGNIEDINNKYIKFYVKDHFNRLLDAYNVLTHKDLFANRLLEIYFFLDTNLVETAIDKYYELVPIYNSLARYANFNQRDDMYKLLSEAYNAIQNKLNKQKNLKIEVKSEEKSVERFKPPKKIERKVKQKKELKVQESKKVLEDPLKEAKLLIKRGDIGEAEKLLSRLL